jgi:thioredoxin
MKIKNLVATTILSTIFILSCQGQQPPKKETPKSTQTGIIHLTNATFKQKVYDYEKNKEWKYAGDKPCIIDFYADWCGPCRMLAPTVEQIARDYQGRIHVYKVNVDEQKELASAFGISGIPAILFCPQMERPQMSTGYISKADFDKAIKEVLKVH